MQLTRAQFLSPTLLAGAAIHLFYLDSVLCFNREPRLRQLSVWKKILPQYDPPIWPSEKAPPSQPFFVIWNAPTFRCGRRFGLPMELHKYGISANDMELFHGDVINLFYESRLGLYPKMLKNGRAFNGGIPQLANFTAHFEYVKADIDWYIPNKTYDGLAVIDWEAWRPLFKMNYSRDKKRYALRALAVVQRDHPWLRYYYHIRRKAEHDFNAAARRLMDATHTLCQKMRPKAKWGFYLYPSCFNTKPGQRYCKKSTLQQNDQLHWLYRKSKALYPSIYLKQQQNPEFQRLYVEGTLREAFRVGRRHAKPDVKVIPYSRITYANNQQFYNKGDLESTIAQAADSGASGIVIWESSKNIRDKSHCMKVRNYVDGTLGPFVRNVMQFTQRCSQNLCFGRGRCVSRQWSNYGLLSPGSLQKRRQHHTQHRQHRRDGYHRKHRPHRRRPGYHRQHRRHGNHRRRQRRDVAFTVERSLKDVLQSGYSLDNETPPPFVNASQTSGFRQILENSKNVSLSEGAEYVKKLPGLLSLGVDPDKSKRSRRFYHNNTKDLFSESPPTMILLNRKANETEEFHGETSTQLDIQFFGGSERQTKETSTYSVKAHTYSEVLKTRDSSPTSEHMIPSKAITVRSKNNKVSAVNSRTRTPSEHVVTSATTTLSHDLHSNGTATVSSSSLENKEPSENIKNFPQVEPNRTVTMNGGEKLIVDLIEHNTVEPRTLSASPQTDGTSQPTTAAGQLRIEQTPVLSTDKHDEIRTTTDTVLESSINPRIKGRGYYRKRRQRIIWLKRVRSQFTNYECRCYDGWTGNFCQWRASY